MKKATSDKVAPKQKRARDLRKTPPQTKATKEKAEAKAEETVRRLSDAEVDLQSAAKRFAALKTREAVQEIVREEVKIALQKKKVHSMVHSVVEAEMFVVGQPNKASASPPTEPSKEIVDTEYKVCRVCETNYPLEMYSKDKAQKDGLSTVCKSCSKAYRSPEARAERARLKKLKQKRSRTKK